MEDKNSKMHTLVEDNNLKLQKHVHSLEKIEAVLQEIEVGQSHYTSPNRDEMGKPWLRIPNTSMKNGLFFCHMSSVRSTIDCRGPVTQQGSG